jgi:GNAT superfamily N-acetyltransferase
MRVNDLIIRETGDSELLFVRNEEEYHAAFAIIKEYSESLTFSLDFQDFEQELAHLSTHYAPPTGFIMLAKKGSEYVGVTCLRNLGHFIAEIKRMYIKPDFRRQGYGRKMLEKAISEAKILGYRFLRLDTVPDMQSANELYTSVGFYEIEDYTYNPLPGARFMEYKL